ncbi:hypothetical protein [Fonticella tunisiensis]|uniref:Uncharacterized protein n=1 Tax=Fonticella tunisiensis TaxID=1096341 RepID=A0A4R7KAY9_9CLOT|nr:hypothetical protein [Fonticella tunisiensis]TDT47638.1 hypothetical protein EDD71_13424 [Fonticella tunisiensis]
MYICPVCNGLIDYIKYCKRCGERMNILDRLENYYDDYSPYLSYELTDMDDGDMYYICSHLGVCPNCGDKEIIGIRNVIE